MFNKKRFISKNVALITYHNALNYGSVLQALATQTAILNMGATCKVIDYVLDTQKRIYATLHWDKDKNPVEYQNEINDLGPLYELKVTREKRFNSFIHKHLNLTARYNEFEPALNEINKYDVAISGSDQILNRNTGEIGSLPMDYMRPYLVDAINPRKVSYASSFANTTDEQLELIKPYLAKFDYFSVREMAWQEKISSCCKCKVEHVCDPTALLSKEEWVNYFHLKKKKNDKYIILFYTLYNYNFTIEKIKILLSILGKGHFELHIVAPFCEKSLSGIDPRIVECLDDGPQEFLNEIYNADFIIPESFHGLMLSIILNKPFVCPCGTTGPELRKMEVLEITGLKDRWRGDFHEITLGDIYNDYDFTTANQKLAKIREHSLNYLKKAIFD